MADFDYNSIHDEFLRLVDDYTNGGADAIVGSRPAILQAIFNVVHDLNTSHELSGETVVARICDAIATERGNGLPDDEALDLAKAAVRVVQSHEGFNLDIDMEGEGDGGEGHVLANEAFDAVDEEDDDGGDGGEDGGHGDGPHGGAGGPDDPEGPDGPDDGGGHVPGGPEDGG
ncbi:uncharacterized protein TrAFT101_010053 [Trichoderma asperellum]|uniref:Uncharacterized protein n=1 Tax=Trichoderma asperellum (strain ATCC 204424 / CBS 433.97 / NBRC 101777) TaxID=1042311 RepID=A0A2T3Z946_TRIA4|nr:hypothetical protein M441DRAFT_57502 [Trichoderma asperellum CBS 433.97]PTB41333.1 hypothetical protein M441DRAFT_57502 [Trichoderma asperellum CBS 433.97]UKZ95203.1 hypothetical protein TrAFT101_010053 [Trichoderma asperellum]